jgi:hypothetical protein
MDDARGKEGEDVVLCEKEKQNERMEKLDRICRKW